jgi:hypothetical protein
MEALVNDAGAEDLLDFYRIIEMSPGEMLIHWRLQQVKDKFLLLVDTRHSSETFKGCILFVKNRLIGLMACFWPSGGKTTKRTCTSHIPRAISIDPPFPLWVPPSNLASQLPPTPSCSESIVKSKEDVEPKESIRLDKDVSKDLITDKDIKEVPSISTSLLEIPTAVLPSKEDANGALNIIGNIAEGNLEFMESFSHLSLTRAPSLMMFAVDPQLQSFHHGHQAFSTVKLKVYTNGKICMVLSDPSGHSVIPIPYQNHGESVTECSLLESVLKSPHFSFEPTDFSLLKSILESPIIVLNLLILHHPIFWRPMIFHNQSLPQFLLCLECKLPMIPLSVKMTKQHQVTRIWISVLLL